MSDRLRPDRHVGVEAVQIRPSSLRRRIAGLGTASRPRLSDAAQLIGSSFVIFQLGIEKRRQGTDCVLLSLSDVRHALENVFGAVVELGLVDAQLFFKANVVLLGLLYLAHCGIVGESAAFKLLASGLWEK